MQNLYWLLRPVANSLNLKEKSRLFPKIVEHSTAFLLMLPIFAFLGCTKIELNCKGRTHSSTCCMGDYLRWVTKFNMSDVDVLFDGRVC